MKDRPPDLPSVLPEVSMDMVFHSSCLCFHLEQLFPFCLPVPTPPFLRNRPVTMVASPVHPLPSAFSSLTQLVVRGRHNPFDGDRYRAQFAALWHDDIEKATLEAGDRLYAPVQTALMSHHRGSRQLAGFGQVICVAANLYLGRRVHHV